MFKITKWVALYCGILILIPFQVFAGYSIDDSVFEKNFLVILKNGKSIKCEMCLWVPLEEDELQCRQRTEVKFISARDVNLNRTFGDEFATNYSGLHLMSNRIKKEREVIKIVSSYEDNQNKIYNKTDSNNNISNKKIENSSNNKEKVSKLIFLSKDEYNKYLQKYKEKIKKLSIKRSEIYRSQSWIDLTKICRERYKTEPGMDLDTMTRIDQQQIECSREITKNKKKQIGLYDIEEKIKFYTRIKDQIRTVMDNDSYKYMIKHSY